MSRYPDGGTSDGVMRNIACNEGFNSPKSTAKGHNRVSRPLFGFKPSSLESFLHIMGGVRTLIKKWGALVNKVGGAGTALELRWDCADEASIAAIITLQFVRLVPKESRRECSRV